MTHRAGMLGLRPLSGCLCCFLITCGGDPPRVTHATAAVRESAIEHTSEPTDEGPQTEPSDGVSAARSGPPQIDRAALAQLSGRGFTLVDLLERLRALGVHVRCPDSIWVPSDEGYEEGECEPAPARLGELPVNFVILATRPVGRAEDATASFDLVGPEGAAEWGGAIRDALLESDDVLLITGEDLEGGRIRYLFEGGYIVLVPAQGSEAPRLLFRMGPRPRPRLR